LNPGGLLNEGVAVAGRFLRKGQVVVKHGAAPRRRNRIWPAVARAIASTPSSFWSTASRRRLPRSSPGRFRIMTGPGYWERTPSGKGLFRPSTRFRRTPVLRSPPPAITRPADA
jgi:carboxyl-terminal processing protease